MDGRADAVGPAARRLIVAGLGPGSLDRLPAAVRAVLEDPARRIVLRTIHHPAAAELAERRSVETCDDLYAASETFDGVYSAIARRVVDRHGEGPTVYAVPGSPLVGEFAVAEIRRLVPDTEVILAESFIDAVLDRVGCDPLERGLRVLNGHDLPEVLALDAPTIVCHLDTEIVLADVTSRLSRALMPGTEVTVCANLGAPDETVVSVDIDAVPTDLAGFRTSLFVDAAPAGWVGLVAISSRLRRECPWDRQQTHTSLVTHLVEETNELIAAIAELPADDEEIDYVAYAGVEEELGDVLLQVLFHVAIATERAVFGIDDVATRLAEKLVRRHPHVFGDVVAETADEVASNWEAIKSAEKNEPGGSLMDGVPEGMGGLERAAKLQRRAARVGFDWTDPSEVLSTLDAEVGELTAGLDGDGDPAAELGDILFTAVNLSRHLGVSPEVALRQATARFETRFRAMEEDGPLAGLDLDALEARWQAAKGRVG